MCMCWDGECKGHNIGVKKPRIKPLPTIAEYNWYVALNASRLYSRVLIGRDLMDKYKAIDKKVKNIKFPATEEEIYNQLKP